MRNSGAWFRRAGAPLWIAAGVLAICIGAVYGRTLRAPFIFDDRLSIIGNETITSLWPLFGTPEHPGPLNSVARLTPMSPRPLVNLSFAINHAFGGFNPAGYHAVNIVLHFYCAMLIWAIVRRTLRLPYFIGRFESSAGWLALAVALLWAVHPLVTEAVCYTTQRSELMMSLFYLLTFYCSLRYWERDGSRSRSMWLLSAVLACLCGMASKEVMVSAPLMVLLFARTFVHGSLAESWRRSRPLYVGLAATWILLPVLQLMSPKDPKVGFGADISPVVWWLTQAKVLCMYLKLVVWPWPLLVHYEVPYLTSIGEAWPYVLVVAMFGVGTMILLWRNKPLGFLGTWVFAILSPTSIIPILMEPAAERRMYLPLVAFVLLFVVGVYRLAELIQRRALVSKLADMRWGRVAVAGLVAALAQIFALVSARHLSAYDNEVVLWQEVLQYQPQNPIGLTNLGFSLNLAGRPIEAAEALRKLLALKPNDATVHNNLGVAMIGLHRYEEAVGYLQEAVRLDPKYAQAQSNLGNALTKLGRVPEAITALEAARNINSNYATAHNNLGIAFIEANRLQDATSEFQRAVEIDPGYQRAHRNLGIALARGGKTKDAIQHFERAVQLKADDGDAHFYLGDLLAGTGNLAAAIEHFETVTRLQPNNAAGFAKLGDASRLLGQPQKAIEAYRAALSLEPNNLQVSGNLTLAYNLANQPDDAIANAEKALGIARSTGQDVAAKRIEAWLSQYRSWRQQNDSKQRAASGSREVRSRETDTGSKKP